MVITQSNLLFLKKKKKVTLATVDGTDWRGTDKHRSRTTPKDAKGPLKKPLSICPHDDVHKDVNSSIIHNSKSGNKLMSIYWWKDKQTLGTHTMEYNSAIERNEVLIYGTTYINLKKQLKWRKPDEKGLILYNPIYMNCPEKATLSRQEVGKCLPRAWAGVGINCKWARESLPGWWKCSQTGVWWWLHNLVNLLGSVVYRKQMNFMYVNCTTINLS